MLSKKKILIAEDNRLNREILTEILSDQYTVLQAENGLEALEILQRDKESVSLILLDVMMPVMDGYTFLDRIRQDEELSLIPVIVMTQSEGEEDEISALEHGATDFVPKPYRPEVILHRVAGIIRLREEAAVANQFRYDRLTGVYSKDFFYQKVQEELAENPDRQYSIVFSNIENFKLYNDVFGSLEGDRLLKEVADISKKMVGDTGFCGRFGADHFICLQEQGQERLDRQNFGRFADMEIPSQMKNIVMRWGIYEIVDRSVPVEQMCDRAMLAAYSIKGKYNQFFAVYDDSMRSELLREKEITDAMERALAEEQFTVYLQPQYGFRDKRIVGAEALVRWIHPEWGFMSPAEFIPLFEKNGFIFRLDRYVWEKVCALLSEWKKDGKPLLPVSVNVSRADLYHADLVSILLGLTEKYEIDPRFLYLEITESAYAENPGRIVSTVKELRDNGFVIEMDDFGSGYSSLNMLSQMKLDILKLDMAFIRNETSKPEDESILNDIINMAHRIRLKVVAEGVETREQALRLQAVGCDYAQGYFFAKPMPVKEFETLREEYSSSAVRPVLSSDGQEKSELFEGTLPSGEASDLQSASQLIEGYRKRLKVLQEEAHRDYLTGLLNRRGLRAAMDSLRKEDLPLAVCLFDLDNLKKTNDEYGHAAGDKIIQSFADMLRNGVGEEEILCRYGGDEFIVILKELGNTEEANEKVAEICLSFRERFLKEDFPASCSCGVAFCPTDEKPSEKLIERADRALYDAKRKRHAERAKKENKKRGDEK